MMQALLRLAATRPQLLAAHAEAYAELAAQELALASATWRRRALLQGVALVSAGVATGLAGVALMLWAAIPLAAMPAPGWLLAVPLLPAVLAAACLLAAGWPSREPAFAGLRQQWQADQQMLAEAELS